MSHLFRKFLKQYALKKKMIPFYMGIILIIMISTIISVIRPKWQGQLVDILSKPFSIDTNSFMPFLWVFLSVLLINYVITYIQNYLSVIISEEIAADMRSGINLKLSTISYSFFDHTTFSDVLQKSEKDVQSIKECGMTSLIQLISNIVTLAVIVPYMFFINVEIASFNLALLLCIPIISKILGKYIRGASKRVLDSYNSSINGLNDNYKNWVIIRLFNCYKYCLERYNVKNNKYKKDLIHQNFLYFMNSAITLIIQFLGTVVIWVIGANEIMRGHMTIGTIMALMSYQAIITSPIIYIASFSNNYHTALISLKDLYDLLDFQNDNDNDLIKIPFNEPIKSIILKDLTYSYNTSTQPIFKNLNAHFYAGKIYIISGKSGQGKSTLFKILAGLIDATKGQILINSRSMNTIRHQDYWKQLGYVLQRSQFFEDSVIRNIDVNGNLDMGVIQDVCKRLDLYQDIISLPQKWETVIETDCTNFSEGQLRRLDIARTALKSASVVIFDEVTANIDDDRKNQFYQLVRCLADEGKIVIFATHNSNEIQYADVVYSLSIEGLKEVDNENRSN